VPLGRADKPVGARPVWAVGHHCNKDPVCGCLIEEQMSYSECQIGPAVSYCVVQVAEALRRRPVGNTEYVELPACGHVPMDEYPDQFVQILRPFVEKALFGGEANPQMVRGNGAHECKPANQS
jgi:hypothetical protein